MFCSSTVSFLTIWRTLSSPRSGAWAREYHRLPTGYSDISHTLLKIYRGPQLQKLAWIFDRASAWRAVFFYRNGAIYRKL